MKKRHEDHQGRKEAVSVFVNDMTAYVANSSNFQIEYLN